MIFKPVHGWREFSDEISYDILIYNASIVIEIGELWTTEAIETPSKCCFLINISVHPWIIYDGYRWCHVTPSHVNRYTTTIKSLAIVHKMIIDRYIGKNIEAITNAIL